MNRMPESEPSFRVTGAALAGPIKLKIGQCLEGLVFVARSRVGACASKVFAIAIPRHRVARSNGSASGYRWGVERKRSLLDRERAR